MDFDLLTNGITGIITAVCGYFTGRRKKQSEADKAAFDAYSFALQSLRTEFETRIGSLQEQVKELQKHSCFVESCEKRKG